MGYSAGGLCGNAAISCNDAATATPVPQTCGLTRIPNAFAMSAIFLHSEMPPAAGSGGTRGAPKTPASWPQSAGQSQNAAPLPAGSHLQSEPQNEPERKAPRPSSPSPCRFPTKAICCRIFTPALPGHPAASVRDFCSGDYTVRGRSQKFSKRRSNVLGGRRRGLRTASDHGEQGLHATEADQRHPTEPSARRQPRDLYLQEI
jgi:hypothetical protein